MTDGTYLFSRLLAAGSNQIFIPILAAQLTGVAPYALMLVVLVLSSGAALAR